MAKSWNHDLGDEDEKRKLEDLEADVHVPQMMEAGECRFEVETNILGEEKFKARLKQETHSLRLNGGFPRFRESRKRSKNRSVHSSQTVASSSTRTIKDSQGRQHKRLKNGQRRRRKRRNE